MTDEKTAKKPFEAPAIGPALELEAHRKDYPIMGFIGAGSGPLTDADGVDGPPGDGTDGGFQDGPGDNPSMDGGFDGLP